MTFLLFLYIVFGFMAFFLAFMVGDPHGRFYLFEFRFREFFEHLGFSILIGVLWLPFLIVLFWQGELT